MLQSETDPTAPAAALPFEEDFARSCDRLRGALDALFLAAGADPTQPQGVSRDFGLDKNLTWKVSKFLGTRDLGRAFPYLPGTAGMRRLVRALSAGGVPEPVIGELAGAQQDLDAMIARHAGDRATLEVMLDGLSSGPAGNGRTAQSRRTAFRGNCGLWGIHARARLASMFLAPSGRREGYADTVKLRGLVGLQRFRSGATWPLERRGRLVDDRGREIPRPEQVAVDPAFQDSDGPKLMRRFCSDPLPEIRTIPMEGDALHVLGDGPLGIQGASDLFMAVGSPDSVPYRASADNHSGALGTAIDGPVGALQTDLFVHHSIELPGPPTATLMGRIGGGIPRPREDDGGTLHFPLDEEVEDLGFGLRGAMSPLYHDYVAACEAVHARFGWDPVDFRCYRLTVEHPPMSSVLLLEFPLVPA